MRAAMVAQPAVIEMARTPNPIAALAANVTVRYMRQPVAARGERHYRAKLTTGRSARYLHRSTFSEQILLGTLNIDQGSISRIKKTEKSEKNVTVLTSFSEIPPSLLLVATSYSI